VKARQISPRRDHEGLKSALWMRQSQPTVSCVLVRMVQRNFTIRLRKDQESGYYAARCVELPEAISQGETEEEALANVREAIELILEEYESEAKGEGDKLIPVVV